VTMPGGWGSTPWGAGPWGAGGVLDLELNSAIAIRENVIRLTFNAAPQFNKQLSPNDASNPARFQVTGSPTPVGLDGEPARAVRPVLVERAAVAGSFGAVLDVTLDRPLSPWPTQYIIACNQLVSTTGALLSPAASSRGFVGLYRMLRPQNASSPTPSRDIANPQTYQAQLDPIPQAGDPLALGVIPIDASGDYAFDEGVTQLKKRVFRRLLTAPGAFPALPNYGVGVPLYGKRLGTEAARQQIAVEAQTQIAQEPDVAAVRVRVVSSAADPSITLIQIRIKMSGSAGTVEFDVPFAPV
jgi:hypothetical protein